MAVSAVRHQAGVGAIAGLPQRRQATTQTTETSWEAPLQPPHQFGKTAFFHHLLRLGELLE
jgi:hypothetical protein